jgi:hypothetical protein
VRYALALVVASVVLGAFAPVPAAAAAGQQEEPGSVAIKLVEGPSSRAGDPRASQYVVDHLEPGARITRRIQVDNRTDDEATIQLYAAAASVEGGAFHFADGRTGNELTGWTTVSPPSVVIPAGRSAEATVTVTVPATVQGGERYAVIWAELPGAAGENGITVVNRVGIRMYLSVGGSQEPPTSFELTTLTPLRAGDGRPAVEIAACADGGRAVDLSATVDLVDGPGGTSAGPFRSSGATTLAPGECGAVTVPAPADLPRGPWKAKATLRSGAVERTAEAPITFPASSGAGKARTVTAEQATESGGGRLLALLAALLLVLVAAMAAWWWRRSAAGGRQPSPSTSGPIAP